MHWNLRLIHLILIPIYKSTPYIFFRMNSQIPQNVLILFSSTLVMDPLVAEMMNSNLTKKSVDAFFRARRLAVHRIWSYCFYSVQFLQLVIRPIRCATHFGGNPGCFLHISLKFLRIKNSNLAKTEYIHYILEIYTFIRINPFKFLYFQKY